MDDLGGVNTPIFRNIHLFYLEGFSIIYHPFGGTIILENPHNINLCMILSIDSSADGVRTSCKQTERCVDSVQIIEQVM